MKHQKRLRDRLVLDETCGEYRDNEIRYLVIRPDVLMGAFAALPPQIRREALEAFALSALKFGGRSVQAYRDAGAGEASELLRLISENSAQLGWGLWSFNYGDDVRSLQLTVRNSPFVAGFGVSKLPVCHPIRGIFTSLAPFVFGEQVEVQETVCAAESGGDTCHFFMRLLQDFV